MSRHAAPSVCHTKAPSFGNGAVGTRGACLAGMRTTFSGCLVVGVAALTAAACSATAQPAPPVTPPFSPPATAHELVLDATSCWLGGLWSDALAEAGDERYRGID